MFFPFRVAGCIIRSCHSYGSGLSISFLYGRGVKCGAGFRWPMRVCCCFFFPTFLRFEVGLHGASWVLREVVGGGSLGSSVSHLWWSGV